MARNFWIGRSSLVVGGACVLLLSTASPALAEKKQSGVTFALDAARVVTVSNSTINFGTPSTTEILAGETNEQQHVLTIKANRNWRLQIKGSSSTWSASSGGRANKPVEDLRWKLGSGGTYSSLTTSNVNLDNSASSTGEAGVSRTLFFRVYLKDTSTGILDAPAAYTYSNVVFTISAN